MHNDVVFLEQKPLTHFGVNIAHLNLCCIVNKSHDLYLTLRSKQIDILSLNESWLHSLINNSSLFLSSYTIFRLDRCYSRGGGECVLVSNKFNASVINSFMSPHLELLHIIINFPHALSFNFVSCYRSLKFSYVSSVSSISAF